MARKKKIKPVGSLPRHPREFRKKLSNLRRSGILPDDVDIRSARNTQQLKSLLTRYSDIAEGKAQAIKVPKKIAAEMKAKGHKGYKDRIIVQKLPEETFQGRRGTSFRFKSRITGIHSYNIPVSFENLGSWFKKAIAYAEQEELDDDLRYAFRFFENPSHDTFMQPDDALRFLHAYVSVEKTIRYGDDDDQQEIYDAIEVVVIDKRELGVGSGSVKKLWRDLMPHPKKTGGPYSGKRRPKGLQKGLRYKPKRKNKARSRYNPPKE